MAKTENFNQERIDARDYAMQVFCWCIVAAMHQNEGIGANRLMKACNEMEEFEAKYATAIRYGGREAATGAMRKDLTGLCDLDIRLPVLKAPATAGKNSSVWPATKAARLHGWSWLPPAAPRSSSAKIV